MIASLPMYDWPEIRTHTDTLWSHMSRCLASQGIDTPKALTRGEEKLHWQRDDLLMSQTCIYPLVTELPNSTVVLGTPIHNVPGSESGLYASVLLGRKSDSRDTLFSFRNSTLAFNGTNSQSGFNALRNLLVHESLINEETPVFFNRAICTGSHRASISAVADGSADLCAIDPVSWALAQQHDSHIVSNLQELQLTGFSPALPLICNANAVPPGLSQNQWSEATMSAFSQAISETGAAELLLSDITYIPKSEYLQLTISNLDMITDPGQH